MSWVRSPPGVLIFNHKVVIKNRKLVLFSNVGEETIF
jgi:hypothetical protein